MANEFKVKKGLIVEGSGGTVLDIQGSQGQLFSITDILTGDIFSVSDISGIPIFNINSDGTGTHDGNFNVTGNLAAYNFSGNSSGTNTGDQNVLPTHGNYVWSAATLASGYTPGLQTSFVRAADGWPEYGAVIHVGARGGSDAGGDFQIFGGHGASNGGNHLRFRNADNSATPTDSWTGWKTILDTVNHTAGTGASNWTAGNDARLSDARAPLSHTHPYLPTLGKAADSALLDGKDHTEFGATLATYGTTAGASGRIRCTAPFKTNTGNMFQVSVSIYSSYSIHNYVVSGYMYSYTNNWYEPKAIYSGTGSPDIKVGRDSNGYAYISIANGDYTGVRVHNMTRGYDTSLADTYNPWTIAFDAGTENSLDPVVQTTWTTGNLSNNNQLSNGAGYITGYSEADTLATVTARGSTTNEGITINGALTVGNSNSSDIYMVDGDETTRRIHCNSNRIGFLTSSNGWGSYSFNNGDWKTDFISYAGASMRAPIFYDSNDTNYYVNPRSTSRFSLIDTNDIEVTGQAFFTDECHIASGGQILLDAASNGMYVNSDITFNSGKYIKYSTTHHFTPRDTSGNMHLKATAGGMYFDSPFHLFRDTGNYAQTFRVDAGIGTASASLRAPIFYDSNNTGYYTNPASTSSLKGLTVEDTISGDISGNADTVDGRHASAIGVNTLYKDITVAGDADTYYPVTIQAGGAFAFQRYSVSRRYNDPGPSTWNTSSHRGGLTFTFEWSGDGAWGGNSKDIRVVNFAESYSTMVAGMALPTSGGVIVWLRGGSARYRLHTPKGSECAITVNYSGYTGSNGAVYSNRTDTSNTSSEIYGRFPIRGNDTVYSDANLTLDHGSGDQTKVGTLQSNRSLRAPVFYDSDNTTYYLSPNLTSRLNSIYVTPIAYAGNQSAYALKIGASNNTAFDMGIKAKSTYSGGPYMSFCSDTTENVIVVQNSRVGINRVSPSYNLDVVGTGGFSSTVTASNFILSSDKRLKENIKTLEPKKIDIKWKSFNLKTDNDYRTGVIAQELEVKHPEFVETDKEGFKSVKYIDLLIAKIAELEARLEKAGI